MKKTVIFMGTPQIAVPSLEALIKKGYNVPLVVSQPDRPKGRGNQVQHTPVKEVALSHNIEVYQPLTIKNNTEMVDLLRSFNADFFAVVAYGRILPISILSIPKYAPINVHFSLLPKYRGAAPVNWAIMNGDEKTGVATMKMDVGMDTGDILLMRDTPIGQKDAVALADELSFTGADLLIETIERYDTITPQPQDHAQQSPAPMMSKESGRIDWSKTAAEIERMTRAFTPWPTAYSTLQGKGFKIFSAEVTSDNTHADSVGVIISVGKQSFTVATGGGALVITELQPEGKRRMSAADFLAGCKLTAGDRFE